MNWFWQSNVPLFTIGKVVPVTKTIEIPKPPPHNSHTETDILRDKLTAEEHRNGQLASALHLLSASHHELTRDHRLKDERIAALELRVLHLSIRRPRNVKLPIRVDGEKIEKRKKPPK